MTSNMGTIDRIIRFIAGIFITSLFFWGPKKPWALLGLIPLVTAVIGFCPSYVPFGISTRGRGARS